MMGRDRLVSSGVRGGTVARQGVTGQGSDALAIPGVRVPAQGNRILSQPIQCSRRGVESAEKNAEKFSFTRVLSALSSALSALSAVAFLRMRLPCVPALPRITGSCDAVRLID
jgi:hypothetical protein